MLRNFCIAILLSAGLASAADKTWGAQQGTNSTALKLKTISFCLDMNATAGWFATGNPVGPNTNFFLADVYSCEQLLGGAANPTKLGQVSWNCVWGANPNNLDPPPADMYVPCQGMISVTSGKQAKSKGYPLSTAYYAFWAPAAGLFDVSSILLSEQVPPPREPIVLRSTGSWPKPDMVSSFTWSLVVLDPSFIDAYFQVTVEYKTKGWNPISVLAGK